MKPARSKKEIEKIRQAILEQALDIIVEQGLESLTMRSLAGRLEMTAPNLYNFFSGKDEIYLSLVVKGFEMLYGTLEAAATNAGTPADRARSMIAAYIDFGLHQPRYYDIMFTLPTPKYNDYKGTPYETLSETEYQISMDIARLAENTVKELLGADSHPALTNRRLIQVWSLLHGMVSLHNSRVVTYVAEGIPTIYETTIEELLTLIRHLPHSSGANRS